MGPAESRLTVAERLALSWFAVASLLALGGAVARLVAWLLLPEPARTGAVL